MHLSAFKFPLLLLLFVVFLDLRKGLVRLLVVRRVWEKQAGGKGCTFIGRDSKGRQ